MTCPIHRHPSTLLCLVVDPQCQVWGNTLEDYFLHGHSPGLKCLCRKIDIVILKPTRCGYIWDILSGLPDKVGLIPNPPKCLRLWRAFSNRSQIGSSGNICRKFILGKNIPVSCFLQIFRFPVNYWCGALEQTQGYIAAKTRYLWALDLEWFDGFWWFFHIQIYVWIHVDVFMHIYV